jgi:hypothetical protein
VISLYKLAKATDGTQKEEAIDEALAILAKLDAAGQLNGTKRAGRIPSLRYATGRRRLKPDTAAS